MRTAITSTGLFEESLYDLRFGRCPFICILEENGAVKFLPNEYSQWKEGAGSGLAHKMIEMKVRKVISGDFGPIVQEILKENNIQMVVFPDNDKTVGEIIQIIKSQR